MIPLRKYIGESVFDGKSEEDIAQNVNKLGNITRCCYTKNKNIFDGLTGSVQPGSNGIEIYAPWFGASGVQEFMIESTAKKLDLGISKFRGSLRIKCKNLQTLEGIFTPDCEFMGRLWIWSCPNLKSLKGLPKAIMKDPEVRPGYQNGFLGLNTVLIKPTQEQIAYLPKKMSELSWGWGRVGDDPNLIKRMSIRSQIAKHTNGLETISLQGHFYKRI